MGLDLRLLPVDHWGPMGFSHSVLRVAQDYALFDRIKALRPRILPPDFHINAFAVPIPDGEHKGELMYGELKQDAYGDSYTYVTAAELARLFDEFSGPPEMVAYIKACKPDRVIILDWW